MSGTPYASNSAYGDLSREEFIEKNMPLVGFVTGRFMGRGYEYDDLYQYGCIGLIKAVDRFNPDYGVAFSTYAVPLIIGEIKRFLRGDGSIHVSRTIRENAVKVLKSMEKSSRDGKSTSIESICTDTGLDRHDAVLAMSALTPVKSLYEPVGGEGEILLQDVIGNNEGDKVTDHIAITQALSSLSSEEQELIVRRYFRRHTQTVIATDMGMTQVQISRMEKKILSKLRSILI